MRFADQDSYDRRAFSGVGQVLRTVTPPSRADGSVFAETTAPPAPAAAPMNRIAWQLRYAALARRSYFQSGFVSAWREAASCYAELGHLPPSQAVYFNYQQWGE